MEEVVSYCSGCGEKRPKAEFWNNKRNKDGVQSLCKVHHKEKTDAYSKANPHKNAQFVRAYEAAHPEKVAEWSKASCENRKKRMEDDPVYAEKKRAVWRAYYHDVVKPRRAAAKKEVSS